MIDLGLALLIWLLIIIVAPLAVLTIMVTLATVFGNRNAD
jgi:hypothetical protein